MRTVSLPADVNEVLPTLQEIIRRAVDGTTGPLFVDYANNRVIIGGVTASGSAGLQVFADIAVRSVGGGYVFADGTKQTTAAIAGGGAASPYYSQQTFGGF